MKNVIYFVVIALTMLFTSCVKNNSYKNEFEYLTQGTWQPDSVVTEKGIVSIKDNISNQTRVLIIPDPGDYVDSILITLNDSIIPIIRSKDSSIFSITYDFAKIDTTKINSIEVKFKSGISVTGDLN